MKYKSIYPNSLKLLVMISLVAFLPYFVSSQASEQTKLLDSLRSAYQTAKTDTAKCDILSAWGDAVFQENPDSSFNMWTSALNLAEENLKKLSEGSNLKKAYTLRMAGALGNIGATYVQRGDLTKAIELTNQSLLMRTEIDDKEGIANCLNNLGYMYTKQGNVASAMDCYFKCLKISEETNDKRGIGFSLLNIAAGFARQGELDEALNYDLKCLKIREELNDQFGIATVLTNIGVIYDLKKDPVNSLKYYFRTQKIYEELGRKKGLSDIYNNIGNVYNTLKEHEKALDYYTRSYAIKQEIKDKPGQARVLTDLSKAYFKLGKYDKALPFAESSLQLSQEIGYLEYIRDASEHLKRLYEKKGDLKNAIKMYDLFIHSNDSLNNEKAKKASIRTQFQFEYDKKEALLKEQQTKELALEEIKNKNQKIISWSIGIGLVLLIVFTAIIFNRLRITRAQKQKIEIQKLEVETQKSIIDKKNTENELLLGEIHHRVKNNLQVISSLLSLQERSTENEGARSAILEGKERVKCMELVHKMLYQKNNFSGIEMQDYVNKLSLGLLESFGLNKTTVELNTDFVPLTLDVDTAVPLGLILNELIVNSLKHAKNFSEKLNLKIEMHLNKNNELQLDLADNGDGKLVEIEKSNSFGLKIVRALIRQLNGVMEIKEDKGLKYSISFKNYKLIA